MKNRSLSRITVIPGIILVLSVLLVPALSFAQPANDNCIGAVVLPTGTTCVNTVGTLLLALPSVPAPPIGTCLGTPDDDVWYSFVAQTAYPTITLSGIGSNLNTAGPRVQLLSRTGPCLGFASVACGTTSINTSVTPGGAGLVVGDTYYIRVYSNAAGAPGGTAAQAGFSICVTDRVAARIEYSKSYINVTKGFTGGTIDPGDTLEMRATIVIFTRTADSIAFYDTLFNTRGLRLVPGSISLRTNEGKIYKSFTDAFDADAGWTYQSGLDTVIRINLGFGPTASQYVRGKLRNNSRPRVFASPCLVMATYRVVVYAPYNTLIGYSSGAYSYRDTATGVMYRPGFRGDSIMVYQSPGLCPNAVSVSNAIGVESNGTFGTPSGVNFLRNRGTSAFTGYTYNPFVPGGGPQDYYYGTPNNTSARYTLLNNWFKADPSSPSYRVFALWDIIGDHTGATNPGRGNPPCDTTQAVSASNPCGYMLVINSAYRTDTAFQYTVSSLCPNTYYEISAWLRNVCYKCAADSTGTGASSAGYIPFAPGDSSGVQPNLAFEVNGIDYYTTGNLRYIGTTPSGSDTSNRWVKRGFTYKTGPSQTSFTLTLRNNAPGGGGNDWAIDDISVATCLPNMRYSPSTAPTICQDNSITINDTVRSYFDNYNNYKWQRSTDGGLNWTDETADTGPVALTPYGTEWEYIATYTIPASQTTLANNGDQYRLVAATTIPNLANTNCQVTDGVSTITLSVIDCGIPLSTDLLSFNGKLLNNFSNLSWTTSKEDEPLTFEIDRSNDGTTFTKIGMVKSHKNYTSETNQYSFIDSVAVSGKASYRLVLVNNTNKKKYSRTIQLKNEQAQFQLLNVVNPFSNELTFDVQIDRNANIDVFLLDIYGKLLKKTNKTVYAGVNSLSLGTTTSLSSGLYVLQVKYKENIISKKIVKK